MRAVQYICGLYLRAVLYKCGHYLQVIESIFYMYRATKDPMYRDWGWAMFQAFQRHCKQQVGYSGVEDVMQVGRGQQGGSHYIV